MPRHFMRGQSGASERHCVTLVHKPVYRMLFTAGANLLNSFHFLAPDNNLRAGQLLHKSVSLNVVRMRVSGNEDLDIFEIKTQLFN